MLNLQRTAFCFSTATVSSWFFPHFQRHKQVCCRQNRTVSVKGEKKVPPSVLLKSTACAGSASQYLLRLQECERTTKNRPGGAMRTTSLTQFWGKAVLLHSYSVHSNRLYLADNIITYLCFLQLFPLISGHLFF